MTTDYKHPLYEKFAPLWMKVRDACSGEDAVKQRGETYLPNPAPTAENAAQRYARYKMRAVYFNATGRTHAGLIGIAYAKWPEIVTANKTLLQDADGSGVGLIGQSQLVLSDVLQTGRAGLLTDWPKKEIGRKLRSRAEQEQLGLVPRILAYTAEQILTWQHSAGMLTRVVLQETREEYEAGEVKQYPQLRELILNADAGYTIRVWVKYSETGTYKLIETAAPGLSYIPFAFVGAVNNDASPDIPPLLDLANLNLAHYRNSADFEESAFVMGQPQAVLTGITEDWREKMGVLQFGAGNAWVLPTDADAKLLQVSPNTLAKEAMGDKERMMALLGARLMAPTESAKTATQSAAETKAAYSQLSLACDNVSAAYTKALQWAEGGTSLTSSQSFAIDTDFTELMLDANSIREIVAAWQAGAIPQSDAWAALRKLRVIDPGKTDEKVAGEIEAQGPALNLDEAA